MQLGSVRMFGVIAAGFLLCGAVSPVEGLTQKPKAKAKKPAVKSGGANQVQGMRGKIGDMLFDGKWRFQVVSIETPATFVAARKSDVQTDYSVFSPVADYDADKTFTPKEEHSLIVFRCLVKNGVNSPRSLYCVQPFVRTALADMDGGSHPPIAYDMAGRIFQSRTILPGASLKFAIVFAVPEGTKPKDLIFTLRTIDGGPKEGKDVRVSLVK